MISPRRLTVSALAVSALLALAACATKSEQAGATPATPSKQYVTAEPEIGSRIKKRVKKGETADKSSQVKTFSAEALQEIRPDTAQTAERAAGMSPGN